MQVSYALTFLARENHTKRGVQVRFSVLILLFSAPAFLSSAIAQEVVITHGSANSQRIPEELLPEISFTVEDRLEITFEVNPAQRLRVKITGIGDAGELAVRFHSHDQNYQPEVSRFFNLEKGTNESSADQINRYRANILMGLNIYWRPLHYFSFSFPPETPTEITVVLASNDLLPSELTLEIQRK